MSIGIVILAAGESARMGEPKQLLAHRGATLLHHTIDIAHSIPDAPVAVVLGAHAEIIRPHLDDSDVIVAENLDWRCGMSGSLRAGLTSLLDVNPSLYAVLFLVCDQPLLSASILGMLIAKHEHSGSAIVAAKYNGTLGTPALFACSIFPELLALRGEEGARHIIRAHPEQVATVSFPEGAIDLDTPTDVAAFSKNSHASLV